MSVVDSSESRQLSKVIVFGSNLSGQTGVANTDDSEIFSSLNYGLSSYIDCESVVRIVSSQYQSFLIKNDGSIYSCGSNDNYELGRSGRRGVFQRIDSVERFHIIDVAIGSGFIIMTTKDGKIINWGVNDLGQLGVGDRENKDRPRINHAVTESILQISSGLQHVLALTSSGNVLTWGGNKRGMLGNGQLTSSCVPLLVKQLQHRPVISVTCGEFHSIALTISGNVYVWGENSQGQLGLNDTVPRLRPELVRGLRAAKVIKVSAGKQHTMFVSKSGLLFATGSNCFGQLGIGNLDIKLQSTPVVVEKLRDLVTIDVCCSSGSTLILVKNTLNQVNTFPNRIYACGLNSSGQLGLGHTNNMHIPTVLPLSDDSFPVGISSGPLAFTSFIFLRGIELLRPLLPCLQIENSVNKITKRLNIDVNTFRLQIAAVFSSISVLNASFRSSHSHNDQNHLCIDLEEVRKAYDLILVVDNELITSTLSRATLQLSDHLKECPWDDAENLSVFLIVLENPLLLRPSVFYITIERVISGILSLPKSYRIMLFSWLKQYPSEYFSRVLQVFNDFLSFALTSKINNIDPAPVVIVMSR